MKRMFAYATALALATVAAPLAQSVSGTVGFTIVPEAEAASFSIVPSEWAKTQGHSSCMVLKLSNGNFMSRNKGAYLLTTTPSACPEMKKRAWFPVTISGSDSNTLVFPSGFHCQVQPNGTCKGQ